MGQFVVVVVRQRKRCDICGEGVEALGVVEVVVVRRLKWLVVVVEFVVKRLGIGCCGYF